MVRVVIESDKPIAVNVKNNDGTTRLLKDIEEGRTDESDNETFTTNTVKTN